MREQKANLPIDRTTIVIAAPGVFDITAIVVRRLGDKLRSVKVELVDTPPTPQSRGTSASPVASRDDHFVPGRKARCNAAINIFPAAVL
jgi:hypothetical protein